MKFGADIKAIPPADPGCARTGGALPAEHEVIVIMGGLPPGEPMTAQAGGVTWTRREGESLDDFKARVLADPLASTGRVIFGGLPDAAP